MRRVVGAAMFVLLSGQPSLAGIRPVQQTVDAIAATSTEDVPRLMELARFLEQTPIGTLRVYQFSSGLCQSIECHGLSPDVVKSVISAELASRVEDEKSARDLVGIIVSVTSALVSLLGLVISALAFRRGGTPATVA